MMKKCEFCGSFAPDGIEGPGGAVAHPACVEHTAARADAHCGPGFGRRIRERWTGPGNPARPAKETV